MIQFKPRTNKYVRCAAAVLSFILFTCSLLLGTAPAEEEKTLQGSATFIWTPEAARQESFINLPRHFGTSGFPAKDPNYDEHFKARIEDRNMLGNKVLTYSSNGDYCYYNIGDIMSYCFHSDGRLFKFGISNKPRKGEGENEYAIRDVEYAYPSGNVLYVGLYVSKGESFIFDPQGKLLAHWKGRYAYNEDGQMIGIREWKQQ